MSQPDRIRRRNAQLAPAPILGFICALALAGCATDGGDGPLSGMTASLSNSVGNPLKRPSQQGFEELIRRNCADYTIGGQSVGTLLAGDEQFRTLTARLYRGDVSNDEYINQVVHLHPSDDANIPATGCIIDQLQSCLSGNCDVESAAAAQAARKDAAAGDTTDGTVLAEEAEPGEIVEQPVMESDNAGDIEPLP
jgi:hypothetical protein